MKEISEDYLNKITERGELGLGDISPDLIPQPDEIAEAVGWTVDNYRISATRIDGVYRYSVARRQQYHMGIAMYEDSNLPLNPIEHPRLHEYFTRLVKELLLDLTGSSQEVEPLWTL